MRERKRRRGWGALANQVANSHIPTKNIPTVYLGGVTHVNEVAPDSAADSRREEKISARRKKSDK